MSVEWLINGEPPEALGVTSITVEEALAQTGRMRLGTDAAYDASDLFADGAEVTLTRDGAIFFRGKVKRQPRGASGSAEGGSIVVEDAWAELETTNYLETWQVGSGIVKMPRAILGLDSAGDPISTGAQIGEAVTYAAGAGASVTAGTIDAGLSLWPSEVRNVTCAEVIRQSIRLTPDWAVWLDHAGGGTALNARAKGNLGLTTIPLDGTAVESFDVSELPDRVPAGVVIYYETAATIDGEVFRNVVIDKAGPSEEGPRVIHQTIPLAGMQMQFQKSAIQTRDLPTDQATAKVWLKAKFPELAEIPDAHFNVTEFEKSLANETDEHPEPINPEATRLEVNDATDLPRELVRGSIADWMRVKVGKVTINVTLAPAAGASAETRKLLKSGKLRPFTVNATNATTKIYKGVSQFIPAAGAPSGIASAVYNGLAGTAYEGFVVLVDEDVSATKYVGRRINLGASGKWSAINALVSSASYDITAGRTTITFGPPQHLGPQDFLEIQRSMRNREVLWMSKEERASNELGAAESPGSLGDTVGGYDSPETAFLPIGGESEPGAPFSPISIAEGGGGYQVTLKPGVVVEKIAKTAGIDSAVIRHDVEIGGTALSAIPAPTASVADGNVVYVRYGTDDRGMVKAKGEESSGPVIEVGAAGQASTHYQPPKPGDDPYEGTEGDYWVPLFRLDVVDGKPAITPYQQSDIEWEPYLWLGNNTEEGEGIYKGWDPETGQHEFKGIKDGYGTKATDKTTSVQVSFNAETPDGEGVPVLIAPENGDGNGGEPDGSGGVTAAEKAKFRRVAGYAGGQIKVTEKGNSIEVRGNEFDTDFEGPGGQIIQFDDGLAHAIDGPEPSEFASFEIKVYGVTVEMVNDDPDGDGTNTLRIDVVRDSSPFLNFWVHKGAIFTSQPTGFAGATHIINSPYHTSE